MATVTMACKRAVVEERYPSDRVKKMPDSQISAIYNRMINTPQTATRKGHPTYQKEDRK